MIQKTFVWLLAVFFLATASRAEAQQPIKTPRIGVLSGSKTDQYLQAFQQGLRERGYVEGKDIVIDYRWAEGNTEQIPELLAEIMRLKPDVIVTGVTLAAQAAKKLAATPPIVVVGVGDPVGTGLVASLARPGGNITGLSGLAPELSGKRLELLKESFPKIARVGVFWNPASPSNVINWKETQSAAKAAALRLQSLEVKSLKDVEGAIASAVKERVDALITIRDNVTNAGTHQIIPFAAKRRLPAMYPTKEHVEAGGLMSYAPDFRDIYQRAAFYVDKILKGAKPADLPVEQPLKFEFVINLQTAKQIGATIPQWTLMKADRVIK